MTGPTSAAELFALAVTELNELRHRAHGGPHSQPDDAVRAVDLAAGWPAFSRSAQRLITAMRPDPAGRAAPAEAPVCTPTADRNLRRAADCLGAAADLLDTRDWQLLTVEQRAADADQVTAQLVRAGQVVLAVLAVHPGQLDAAVDVAVALRTWQISSASEPPAASPVASLVEASTVTSVPGQSADRSAANPELAAVHQALQHWQQTAVAVTRQPAPSRSDLRGSARTAGMLTRLAHELLTAHAGPTRTGDATNVAAEQLRRAGAGWIAAGEAWRTISSGGSTLSPDVREAGAALETAVRVFARTGAQWTGPVDLRAKAGPDDARQLARAALTAAQVVAEQHAPLIAHLGRTATLHTQARNLPVPQLVEEPEQRVRDRLAGRFVVMTPGEAAPLVAVYQRLPAATAAARTAYAALNDPDHSPRSTPAAGHRAQPAVTGPQQPDEPARPAAAVPVTLAGQRWQQTLAALDPKLLDDPHYPALAAALDRIQLAGADVPATLTAAAAAAAAAAQPLPDAHAARTLHWHLVDLCPAALTPFTDTTGPTRPPVQPAALEAAAAVRRAAPAAAPVPR